MDSVLLQMPVFGLRPVGVGFVVNRLELGQFVSKYFGFSLPLFFL